MTPPLPTNDDMPRFAGGSIPGANGGGDDGAAAFVLSGAEPAPVPVLIAVPHAGRASPASLLGALRQPEAARRLEDRYVDRIARRVAAATGAALLVARAPRAMIDLNRAPDDIDADMLDPADRAGQRPAAPGSRARTGLGLVPRRLPGYGELWRRRLTRAELDARIAAIHAPYHASLGAALARLRAQWGAALLIDMHSMPPLSGTSDGGEPAAFVIGDRFGASCEASLIAASFGFLAGAGLRALHNRPYAGGYGLERHADPARGIHAMQIEVDRARYLDARLDEEGAGAGATARVLIGLVARLAVATVALAGRGDWAEAAE